MTGRFVERYTEWTIRHRRAVLAVALAVTVAAGLGLPRLGLATDYRVFFSRDNPDLAAYEAIENTYSKNDNVLFVIRPSEGEVFTPRVLEAVRGLTEDAWQIPFSTRVDSITNFQNTWADGDDLIVEDLVPSAPIDAAMATRARDVALSEPLLSGRLVSHDARTTGINVRVSLPGQSGDELPAAVAYVRDLIEKYRRQYPELDVHASGVSMMNAAFAEAPLRDAPFVMPLMLGALVVAIVLFLRSTVGIVATLSVLGMSAATAMGVAGHLGLLLDPVSSSAPTIILTLAVADSVHILVTWLHAAREGTDPRRALVEAVRINAKAVFLTSLTTVVGFLTLNFSDSPPFRLLGNLTAFGVVVAWVYSMTVLPAIVALFKSQPAPRPETDRFQGAMDWFSDLIIGWRYPILAGLGGATLLLSLSIGRLQINDQYIEYFDRSMPIRVASDFTVEHLSGIYTSTFSLDAGASQAVSDPEFLATVDRFADYLEGRPTVVHVNSFTRTMKRLNKNMHGDDAAHYRLPETRDLAAQYLLLYELSLPYGLDVNDQIDVDKRRMRVDVTFGDVDMAVVGREMRAAEAWLARYGAESMRDARATGVPSMFGEITRRNVSSMVLGTALGFVLIALILAVSLRSVRMGLISLVPNVLPAAMAFGIWAWLVRDVGFAVSVVAGLSLGIIVDDTVHFLAKYTLARRERGMSPEDAVRYSFRTVGAAILGTTFIVAAGFAMLGLSTFRVTSYMGLLTALTVLCALLVDFLLLPALLLVVDRARPATASSSEGLLAAGAAGS